MLLNSIIFGAFTAFLTDYWLGRAEVRDPVRLVVAVVVGVVLGVLVYGSHVAYF